MMVNAALDKEGFSLVEYLIKYDITWLHTVLVPLEVTIYGIKRIGMNVNMLQTSVAFLWNLKQ